MAQLRKNVFTLLICALILASCQANNDHPGIEYAPQMYHSVPYEPLAVVTEDGLLNVDQTLGGLVHEYKTNAMYHNPETGKLYLDSTGHFIKGSDKTSRIVNMMKPVRGTVARQNYTSVTGKTQPTKGQKVLVYNLDPEDIEWSAANLKNPVPFNDQTLAEGKHLYEGFCKHCHGPQGKGKGKVAQNDGEIIYAGVANLTGGAYMNHEPGRIFHVITYGKGNMWPHGSQVNPEERWKIVHYVINKLQGRESPWEGGQMTDDMAMPGTPDSEGAGMSEDMASN